MYFHTLILRSRRAILFQRLLPKLGSQVHFNTICFSLAAKIAADTNQLKELREFLRAGNEDSAKRLIQTLNPSSVVDVGKVDFNRLPKAILGTSLTAFRMAFRRSSEGKICKDPCLSHNEHHGL